MTDLKFEIDGKRLSTKEINSKKDFESFAKKIQIKNQSFYQSYWFWTSIGLASFVAVFTLIIGRSNNYQLEKLKTDFYTKLQNKKFINSSFIDLQKETDFFKVKSNQRGILKNSQVIYVRESKFPFSIMPEKEATNEIINPKISKYVNSPNQRISCIPTSCDSNDEKYSFYLNKKDSLIIRKNLQTRLQKNQNLKFVIPDNLVQLRIQKAPEYKKVLKSRIQIQQEISVLNPTKKSKSQTKFK